MTCWAAQFAMMCSWQKHLSPHRPIYSHCKDNSKIIRHSAQNLLDLMMESSAVALGLSYFQGHWTCNNAVHKPSSNQYQVYGGASKIQSMKHKIDFIRLAEERERRVQTQWSILLLGGLFHISLLVPEFSQGLFDAQHLSRRKNISVSVSYHHYHLPVSLNIRNYTASYCYSKLLPAADQHSVNISSAHMWKNTKLAI